MFLQDIALGLFVAVFTSLVGGFEPSYSLIIAGLAGAILPDWDMVAHLALGGKLDKWAHKHRDISHYPLITIPLASCLVWHYYGQEPAMIIAIAMMCHYLADSREVGWGVRWLYPFSSRYFAYRVVGYGRSKFRSWTPKEQGEVASVYGDQKWASKKKLWIRDAVFLSTATTITIIWYVSL